MRLPIVLIGLIALIAGTASAADELRSEISLDGRWQAMRTREAADSPPAGTWQDFAVPGTTWSTAEGGSTYLWLRRSVTVPAEWEGRRVFLNLTGARYDPHVYVDGRLIGSRLGGWSPFEVEITDAVAPGRECRIEVRCQDWGATFVEGFTLPPGGWNDDRVKRGEVMAPIGGHVGFFGPWDSIRLEARPQVYLTRQVVIPSVRKGTLTIQGTLSDPTAGAWVDAEVVEGGRTELQLPAAPVQEDGTWEVSAAFPSARYWSPEDPHLYNLQIHLRRNRNADPIDTIRQRFGFKEFWTDGADFYLNGVKRHLLATSTWPRPQPQSTEFVRNALQYWKDAHCIAFRQHTQPWRKEWTEMADEMGVMMVVEAAMWTDSGMHAYQDPRFWDEYQKHLERMVWRDRNNASVVMWSLENEFLSVGNARWFPDLENRLADMGRVVKALDPYHPILYESDNDPGGVADVIGLHYPHELPAHADYPNTADWLQARRQTEAGGGLLGTVSRDFFWDRKKPLYIGEFLWVPTENFSPGTVFFGDRAYVDEARYNLLAKARAWYDQILAYRRAGVSGFCPWAVSFPRGDNPYEAPLYVAQRDAYVHVAAYLRNRDTRFFGGDTLTRTFDVFNDSGEPQDLELRWALEGTTVQGAQKLTLEPGGYRAVEAELHLPQVDVLRDLQFTARLLADGTEVHSQKATFRVEPRTPLRVPAGVSLLLYDPSGTWDRRLGAEGLQALTLPSIRALEDAHPGDQILLIAPGALKEPEAAGLTQVGEEVPMAEQLAGFLAHGGRVLVMEQDTLAPLSLSASLVGHASTMTFPLDPSHAVLAGIGPDDLKFWRGDNYVSHKEIRRPATAGARTIVVSGGADGLGQGPIVELEAGPGRILLVQALLGGKLATEPVARKLLGNALSHLASLPPSSRAATTVATGSEFDASLAALGVRTAPQAGDDGGLLILNENLPEADMPAVAAALKAGRTVYWHAPEAASFSALAGSLGVEGLKIAPAQGPLTITDRESKLLGGVSREDLYFTGPPRGWRGNADVDLTVVDRAVAPEMAPDAMQPIGLDEMKLEGTYVGLSDGVITFASAGTATRAINVPAAGLYVLSLRLAGTPAAGGLPIAAVRVNGNQVATIGLAQEEPRDYQALVKLPGGTSSLQIAFVNDANVGGEDRNMMLHGLAISPQPWTQAGLDILTQPASIVVMDAGGGRLVLDCVRWDTNEQNRTKGMRYASALLANLGAPFVVPEPEPTWVPWTAFEQIGEYPYFRKANGQVSLGTNGTIEAQFQCVRAEGYDVFVEGHSTPARGEYAKIEVSVDDAVVGEVQISSSTNRSHRVGRISIAPGAHKLTARFTNDLQVGNEDRNVSIRAIGFRRTGP